MPQIVETKPNRVRIRYAEEGYDSGGGYHPRGAQYDVESVEKAREVHPDAKIMSVVTFDSVGNPTATEYTPTVAREAGVMAPAGSKVKTATSSKTKVVDEAEVEFVPAEETPPTVFVPEAPLESSGK